MRGFAVAPVVVMAILSVAGAASGVTVVVGSSKDSTLYQPGILGERSNGAGQAMFAGLTATAGLRRAVLAFDVTSALPRGAVVTSATLTLTVTRIPPGAPGAGFSVHRLSADWGEAGSDAGDPGGLGADPMPGDATWAYTFFDTGVWDSEGGDFLPGASDSTTVSGVGPYSWSNAAIAADVQGWRDTPTTNFGWIVLGDETTGGLARQFDTKESLNAAAHPMLTVEFTPPCTGDADRSGSVVFQDILVVLANFGANYGDGWGPGDADFNGIVNFNDVLAVLANFGATCPAI